MAAPSRLAALSERASTLANNVRRAGQRHGRTDLAQRITAEASRWGDAASTVVVLGQVGAGKTQLVNALTGGAAGLPTGDGGTACVTAVRAATVPRAAITRFDSGTTEADVGEVRRSLTWDGLAGRTPPDAAALDLPAPRMLDGLMLVDTPGVNGVDQIAGRRALAASERADALVYVVDASSPLNASELATLVEAARRVSAVAVVVSRIDRFRGWRTIVADAAAAIRDQPALDGAVVLGVSSRLADAAFAPDLDDDESMELLSDSGLPELQEFLASVVRRIRHVRLRNLVATVDAALDELIADQHAIVAAGSDEAAAEHLVKVDEARRSLAELRDDGSAWLVMLSDGIARVREDATMDLQRRLADFGGRCERAIAEWDGDLEAFTAGVDRDIAQVASAFGDRLGQRVGDLVEVLARRSDFAALALTVEIPELLDMDEVGSADVERPGGESVRLKVTGSLVSAATSSSMLLTMMSGGGDTAALVRMGALGAATVFSGALAAITVRGDRRNRTRQQLRAELRPRLDALRGDGPTRIRSYLLATQRSLEAQIKRELRDRTSAVEARITLLQSAGRAEAAERRRQSLRAEDEIKQLGVIRQDLTALAEALGES